VGLVGITIYAILTILCMTLIGGFVTGVVSSKDIGEGSINGGFLTLILLIAVGLLLGLIIFVTMGIYASVSHTLALSNIPGATTSLSGSNGNSLGNSILNLVYTIITIILSFIFGILGGSLGVIFKERFGI
jgi:hypothetical protein